MQTQVLSGRVLSLYLAVTNYQDYNTPCKHSKAIKTKEKSYTNLLYPLKNPIPIKQRQKIQVKIQAVYSNKAIEMEKNQEQINKIIRQRYRKKVYRCFAV